MENMTNVQQQEPTKLDYTLEDPVARNELVKKIVAESPPERLNNYYLEILADYLIFAMDKKERKENKILTENHKGTITKHEISYEGLISRFETNEDNAYGLMIQNDKNIIFAPKISITPRDLETIPQLKALRDAIDIVEEDFQRATGRRKYLLKRQLIRMRQDQYIIKSAYLKPIRMMNTVKSLSSFSFDEQYYVDQEGNPHCDGLLSLFDPKKITLLLNNYARLKGDSWNKLQNDAYYLLLDLENLIDSTLKEDYPLYFDILTLKIDKESNERIQQFIYKKYQIKYTIQYISSLWRRKIPNLLAAAAEKQYLVWYYTYQAKGKWKRCSRCKEYHLADSRWFSKNKTAKDGFYSVCKRCRNKKFRQIAVKTV